MRYLSFQEYLDISPSSKQFSHELEGISLEIIEFWKNQIPRENDFNITKSNSFGKLIIDFFHLEKIENMKDGWAYAHHPLGKKVDGRLFIFLNPTSYDNAKYYEVEEAIKLLKLKAFW